MAADPPSSRPLIRVVAVVQEVLLDVAEDRLTRIIVGAPLGQAGPVQPQPPHQRLRDLRLDRVRRVAVQGDPYRLPGIPPAYSPQEPADVHGPLAREEGPVDQAPVHLVEQEQIEPAAGLLIPRQDQPLSPRGATAAVRLDRNRLDVEEGQEGAAGPVTPPRPQPVEDHRPVGIGADEFAPNVAETVSLFFSTRRRCSRLIALTTRCRTRYACNLARLQRPYGKPKAVGGCPASRQMVSICSRDRREGAPTARGPSRQDRRRRGSHVGPRTRCWDAPEAVGRSWWRTGLQRGAGAPRRDDVARAATVSRASDGPGGVPSRSASARSRDVTWLNLRRSEAQPILTESVTIIPTKVM